MKMIISSLVLCACFITAFSQTIVISGKVYDRSGQTVPYVNIGIKEQKNGTISNEKGYFKLAIPDSLRNKVLAFSSVGFEDKNIEILSFEKNTEARVVLNEFIIELPQIAITNQKNKVSKIGITGRTPIVVIPAESSGTYDILEQARLIQIKGPSKVLDANIFLESALSDSINVRLNFYSLENGLPGKRIVDKSIIKKFLPKKGWLTFDLTNENIYLDNDFVVSFEYLPGETSKKNRLLFGAKIGAKDSYLRHSSQGAWNKNQLGGATIYVRVES